LKKEGLYESTLIIVAGEAWTVAHRWSRSGRVLAAGQPAKTIGFADAFDISDDGSLIWLADPSLTAGGGDQPQHTGKSTGLGDPGNIRGRFAA